MGKRRLFNKSPASSPRCASQVRDPNRPIESTTQMPVMNVAERLTTTSGRIDLAREVVGVMFHPKDGKARRRRQSALSMTLLGMSDKDDEPEALAQVKTWFKQAGGFKTASHSDPYEKQQDSVLKQLPHILAVG